MAKLTLNTISSGFASTTLLNENFESIETALENTLSRDGTTPNTMSADLDMNGHSILNILASSGEGFTWEGEWVTATAYILNNLVATTGRTYICIVAHISGTFATDLAAGKWQLLADKGAAGAGSGDMIAANNLSDVTSATTARSNLGLAIGTNVQAYDVDIPTTAASQVEMEAGTESALRSMSPLRIAQAIAALVVSSTEPTGIVKDYVGTTAPSGYVLLSGRTIGDASSGATERANADTSDLYTLLWNSMANAEAAVSTGRGASAAADFAAHKTIALPDARGRVIVGKDNMGGTTASRITSAGSGVVGTTLGVAGGAETHTLTESQLASHTHGAGSYLVTVKNGSSLGQEGYYTDASSATTTTSVTGTSGATGSGSAHNNTQPTLVLNKIIKL